MMLWTYLKSPRTVQEAELGPVDQAIVAGVTLKVPQQWLSLFFWLIFLKRLKIRCISRREAEKMVFHLSAVKDLEVGNQTPVSQGGNSRDSLDCRGSRRN